MIVYENHKDIPRSINTVLKDATYLIFVSIHNFELEHISPSEIHPRVDFELDWTLCAPAEEVGAASSSSSSNAPA